MLGYDFHRQKPIGNYIVDFLCYKLRLVIEIDGRSHNESKFEYDKKRLKELESFNLKVLIFADLEVKTNLEGVLTTIELFINSTRIPK